VINHFQNKNGYLLANRLLVVTPQSKLPESAFVFRLIFRKSGRVRESLEIIQFYPFGHIQINILNNTSPSIEALRFWTFKI
jgi:hypothetical protein